jgi:hypothetical protein
VVFGACVTIVGCDLRCDGVTAGGSKDIHETPLECAIREMREECGIDLNQPEFLRTRAWVGNFAPTYTDCRDADVKDAQPLLQLMRSSLFCNNEDHLQFYLKWLATPLQAVESGRIADIKTRVDILLKGPQGKGKGLVVSHLENIYGSRYCLTLEDVAQMQSSFNKHLNEALFLVMEEVGFAGNKADAAKQKNKTTGSSGLTNEKYCKVRTDRKRVYNTQEHFNPDYARHTEMDDRRVAIFQTNTELSSVPTRDEYENVWKPLYSDHVQIAG